MNNIRTNRFHILTIAASLLLIAGATSFVVADPAAADDTPVCGLELTGAEPGQDPIGALNDLLNEGQDAEIGVAEGLFDVGSEICGPAETAISVGVHFVLGGVETDAVDVEIPEVGHVLLAVVDSVFESEALSALPGSDAGSVQDASTVTAIVFNTGTDGLNVEDEPLGNIETNIPDGTSVEVLCQETGPAEEDGLGADELWDYIAVNGTTGFASDAWLNTGTNDQIAPTCGS